MQERMSERSTLPRLDICEGWNPGTYGTLLDEAGCAVGCTQSVLHIRDIEPRGGPTSEY